VPHVLHLLKPPVPPAALAVIREQARDPSMRLTIVLAHGAELPEAPPGATYRLGAPPPDQATSTPIDPAGLLDLIFAADTVVAW
jgi:hypothetical protein